MKKTLLLWAVALIAQAGFTQTGEIKGKVFDSETKETLPGASVYVKIGNKLVGAATDEKGNFTIKPLPSGIYNLYATFMGYDTTKVLQLQVYPEKITFVDNVPLNLSSKILPIIEISSVKTIIEKEPMIVLRKKDIEKIPVRNDIPNLLAYITTDVMGGEKGEVHFRGARSGDEAYYIDGVKVSGDKINIPSASIKNMVVYSGGIPAKYGDLTGGCVIIETMSYFDWLNTQRN